MSYGSVAVVSPIGRVSPQRRGTLRTMLVAALAASLGALMVQGVITPALRDAVPQANVRDASVRGPFEGWRTSPAATFSPQGATLRTPTARFAISLGSVGRSTSLAPVHGGYVKTSHGASYGVGGVREMFVQRGQGLEQSWLVSARPAGRGPLVLTVPVVGVTALMKGSAVTLRNESGAFAGTYANLRVVDRSGRVIPSRLSVVDGGREIRVSVLDRDAVYPLSIDPTWSTEYETTASDGATGDRFGASVAVAGSLAVVGAPGHTVNGNVAQGAAYLYQFANGSWSPVTEVTAADGAAGDGFGASVAISGSTVIIGAPGHTVGGNGAQGAAYVFTLSGSTATQVGEVTASDGAAGDAFGSSVAISGNTLAVGAPLHAVNGAPTQGAVYTYALANATVTPGVEVTAADGAAGDAFGTSVALSGSTLVVGAPQHATNGNLGQGAGYVFTLSGTTASNGPELTAADGAAGDAFGRSVALSGASIVIGAPQHATNGNPNQGAAYLFTLAGQSATANAELSAADGAPGDLFGTSVAISGASIAIGAPNHAVGSNSAQGTTYLYGVTGGTVTPAGELTAYDGLGADSYGQAVSMDGATVVSGAPQHVASDGAEQGSAYFGTSTASSPVAVATIAPSNLAIDGFTLNGTVTLNSSATVSLAQFCLSPSAFTPAPATCTDIVPATSTAVSTSSFDESSAQVTGLNAYTPYFYSLEVIDSLGNVYFSPVASVTTLALLNVVPVTGTNPVNTPLALSFTGNFPAGSVTYLTTSPGCSIVNGAVNRTTSGSCDVIGVVDNGGTIVVSPPTTFTFGGASSSAGGVVKITTPSTTVALGATVSLAASAPAGASPVSFALTGGTAGTKCVLTSTPSETLTSSAAGTCIVVASTLASDGVTTLSSSPVTFTFGGTSQAKLTLVVTRVKSKVAKGATPGFDLSTTGGSGKGNVSYSVIGGSALSSCRISASHVLTSLAAGTCIVAATKAASGVYGTTTSSAVSVGFAATLAQSPLRISGSLTGLKVGTKYYLQNAGGSGSGLVTYVVKGSSPGTDCVISTTRPYTIVGSAPGQCGVIAMKAGSGLYKSQTSPVAILEFVP